MIEKETIDLILDYLFWLATAWLTTFLSLQFFHYQQYLAK